MTVVERGVKHNKHRKLHYEDEIDLGLSSEEKAYLAAIIDGEGHIRINLRGRGTPGESYYPEVTITNTSKKLFDWIRTRIPYGSLYSSDSNRYNKKSKAVWKIRYEMTWSCSIAARVLTDVLPYLVIKRPQAQMVLGWRRMERRYLKERGMKRWGCVRMPPPEIKLQRILTQKGIQAMNQAGDRA